MSAPLDLVEDLSLAAPKTTDGVDPLFWTALIAAVLLAVVAALLLLRRRRLLLAAPIPPEKTALAALESLRAEIDTLDARAFALSVSHILRVYIEGRFGLHAPQRSTEEFLSEATASPQLTAEQQAWLAAFLVHCDRSKFALAGLETAAKYALHQEALDFVRATTPSP